jgi:hypothetical protein
MELVGIEALVVDIEVDLEVPVVDIVVLVDFVEVLLVLEEAYLALVLAVLDQLYVQELHQESQF